MGNIENPSRGSSVNYRAPVFIAGIGLYLALMSFAFQFVRASEGFDRESLYLITWLAQIGLAVFGLSLVATATLYARKVSQTANERFEFNRSFTLFLTASGAFLMFSSVVFLFFAARKIFILQIHGSPSDQFLATFAIFGLATSTVASVVSLVTAFLRQIGSGFGLAATPLAVLALIGGLFPLGLFGTIFWFIVKNREGTLIKT